MCIDAPESTTNSRSSGLRVDAGRHLFSEGEKNAALFFSSNFKKHFWPASTLLHGLLALATLSLPETDPQILERWGCADEDDLGKSFQAMDFGLECVRDVQRRSWILHIRSVSGSFELFRKIDEDFGGSISWDTQPNCRVIFSMAAALFSFFLDLFARLLFNLAMRIRALFSKSASILGLVEQAVPRMPLFTEWIGASSFEVILAWQSSHFPTWASASRTLGSRCIFSHSAA